MCVTTSQYEISGKNHICSVKTFSSRAKSTCQRKTSSEQSAFWLKVKVMCCLATNPLFTITSQYEISGKLITFAQSKPNSPDHIIYPPEETKALNKQYFGKR